MITIDSKIENTTKTLYELETLVKPLGYDIGGNWDYDHGYFDYKIDDEVGYQFLRVPFIAVKGTLDARGAIVQLGKPLVLSHKYQRGLDDHVHSGNMKASFDQFSEPQDPDASVDEEAVNTGKRLVAELEKVLGV